MPVPDFQSFMLPILRISSDGIVRAAPDFRQLLSKQFHLGKADLEELLPSGTQPVFNNRVAWALVHLQKAGLLDRPHRGQYAITSRGKEALLGNPERINLKFLQQYSEFNDFRKGNAEKSGFEVESTIETPEEVFQSSYQQMRTALAVEILEHVKSMSPMFFERLVVEVLVSMGYGGSVRDAGQSIGKSGDEGIDGIIKEDRLGLDVIYIQAKRWEGSVGRPEIQKFVGALHGKHARKGVFLTTGTFAQNAIEYAGSIDSKVVLIDGKHLAELMIDYNVGVTTKNTYHVKRIDSDYFIEE